MSRLIVVVLETGIFSHETSAMKEKLRRFVQQAAAVVGSPRRGMVWSLIVLWVGTGLLCPSLCPTAQFAPEHGEGGRLCVSLPCTTGLHSCLLVK